MRETMISLFNKFVFSIARKTSYKEYAEMNGGGVVRGEVGWNVEAQHVLGLDQHEDGQAQQSCCGNLMKHEHKICLNTEWMIFDTL